jgi:hypothetical protein
MIQRQHTGTRERAGAVLQRSDGPRSSPLQAAAPHAGRRRHIRWSTNEPSDFLERDLIAQHDVFISYRRDLGAHFATAVRSALEQAGLNVALDVEQLKAGAQFLPQLRKMIAASRHFVLLLTKGSLDRMNELNDVSADEVATAYAHGRHVVVIYDDPKALPTKHTVVPDNLRLLLGEHMLSYDFKRARVSIGDLLAALQADSKSKQEEAHAAFARIDATALDPAFQAWQTEYLYQTYAPAARAHGWDKSGQFFPIIHGQRYPLVCFDAADPAAAFSHPLLKPALTVRTARELPSLVVDPEAVVPDWVASSALQRRYFEILSYARRVRRWNMRGFALSALRLDDAGRVIGFDARICTYGENCLTSHVLGYDLLDGWLRGEPGKLQLSRPGLEVVLRNDGEDFMPLISVQAIVAYRDDDGQWRVITMERSGELAGAAGFWQFPPAGGFEIFGTEGEDEQYVRQQFDIRMALMREFLEEIYGDVEMACEAPKGSSSEQEGAQGYRLLLKALRSGLAHIHFLGVVTELVSLRPEFSFLIVLDDIEHFRDIRYDHHDVSGVTTHSQWLKARSETLRLHKTPIGDLAEMFAPGRKWHGSSMGLLHLLAEASCRPDGWLRKAYPDFPAISLEV